MNRRKAVAAALFVATAVELVGTQSAHADPLTPLTPNEVTYLEQARKIMTATHNPMGFHGDGRLLTDGRYACARRTTDIIGNSGTYVDPTLTQLAFIYLCPQ
ncbi:hypothetical protein [Mycobacterium sp. E1747]|uniref:hypothetical protein n=1 Tax=Mycobacterium sp. E1747 TaxID=1834128 RepID=UPI000801C9CA|nr:hypothetical protein [Mycobacterium sp. E1747]OBH11073.1 hypothetical protein A5695_20690 [Mycobacterium sp. E1747]